MRHINPLAQIILALGIFFFLILFAFVLPESCRAMNSNQEDDCNCPTEEVVFIDGGILE
jgi:hypothetical protein